MGVLAGVFVGWALGAGTKPAVLDRALGKSRAAKLLRLLELLEEPDEEESDEEEPDE